MAQLIMMQIFFVDHEDLGVKGAVTELENARYPNHCMSPTVLSAAALEIGEWEDMHPLNYWTTHPVRYVESHDCVRVDSYQRFDDEGNLRVEPPSLPVRTPETVIAAQEPWEVLVQPWVEYDRWSGKAPYGVSLHIDEQKHREYVDSIESKHTGPAPEWYQKRAGGWIRARVPVDLYRQVYREGTVRHYSDHGVLSQTFSYDPRKKGR